VNNINIPNNISEIDHLWLTVVLSQSFPGTEVRSVHIGTVINGTATKVRLLLTYNEDGHRHGLPPTMWFKAGLEAHSEEHSAIYTGETLFYKHLAADLDIGLPIAYFAHVDARTGRSVLLLEDLLARNAVFLSAATAISLEQAASVVERLAKLHARYWNHPHLQTLDWLKKGDSLLFDVSSSYLFEAENWQRALGLPRGQFIKEKFSDRKKMRELMLHQLHYDRTHAHCLIHGDAHCGNLYLSRDGSPAYIDWQVVMRGHWAHDIAYFICSSLSPSDRRHGESDLIDHYLAVLGEQGVTSPGFDTAWLEYRRHVFYNFVWILCPPEWQPEEVCIPCSERACIAIEDLDAAGAWSEPSQP